MKSKLLVSVAALGLLIGGLVGCNGNKGSSEPAKSSSAPASSQPSSSSAAPQSSSSSQVPTSSSSSQAPAHEHNYAKVGDSVKNADKKDVYLMECADKDDKYIAIAFTDYSDLSADFGSTSGYNNVPEALRNESKLLAKNATISWKINVDKAISGAKLAFGVVYTGGDHGSQTGADGSTVKYSYKINDGEFVDWGLGTTTYDEAGLSQTARAYLVYGNIDLVAGENVITLRQNNAGYRLLYGGEVRIHYSGDAKPVEAPIPFEGYQITFVVEHCKVLVFNTKAYETETPVETTSCVAKDEEGKVVAYDPDDLALQPQVSFKVVCDEGYSVTVNNVTVTPKEGYKNLKQNPDAKEGQENIFRVTKVQADLTITIAPSAGEQAKGYKITFVPTHCTIKVYIGPKNEAGDNLDTPEDGVYYGRLKDSPFDVSYTTPQINFEVVCDEGYEFVPEIVDDKVDFITGDYNKFQNKNGCWNITKIASDLTITIAATAVAA